MGKTEKLISKLSNSKKTFDWSELVNLLSSLGYQKKKWKVHGFALFILIVIRYCFTDRIRKIKLRVVR